MTKGVIKLKKAEDYDKRLSNIRFRKQNNFILSNIKGKNNKICDLCCGTGLVMKLVEKKAKQIIGIDLSKDMIRICKQKFKTNKKIKTKLAPANNTKLKSNYFDYAIIRFSLHHIKDKAGTLKEVYRILKPKGKLIIIDKYHLGLPHLLWKSLQRLFQGRTPPIFDEYLVSKKENEQLIKNSKFKIKKKKILPYNKQRTGQQFMYVLEK